MKKTFAELLKQFPDFVYLGGVDNSEIRDAEDTLSLVFAEDYREYLSVYGAACANGHEFTGITKSERLNVIDVTNRVRKVTPNLPHKMYVVEELHIDGIMIMQDENGTIYRVNADGDLKRIGDSLSAII